MDEYTYTSGGGWKMSLIYDNSADDGDVVKDIKSLMESMIVKQVRNAGEDRGSWMPKTN